MSYYSKYKGEIEKVNAQFQDWMNKATSSNDSDAENAEKEQRLKQEGFVSYITPDKQEIWVPKPHAPASVFQDYQKGFSSMSPETLKDVYPCLQYVESNFIPVVEELFQSASKNEISLQYVKEAITKLVLEGYKEAVEKTGGMDKQGNSPIAKASSDKQADAIYARSPKALSALLGGDDE